MLAGTETTEAVMKLMRLNAQKINKRKLELFVLMVHIMVVL